MKKIISLLLCVALLLALCCNFAVSAATEKLTLKYDDRYSFSGYTIDSVTNDTVTSYKVGYGIGKNSVKDTAVVTVDEKDKSKIVATAVGTATVKMTDGTEFNVTVEPAKLSIFFFVGQSNAEGMDGEYAKSISNEDGTCYSTYGPCTAYTGKLLTGYDHPEGLTVANASSFVTASLTGTKNVNGDELIYAPNGLCESGNGKGGMDSAVAYQWYKTTGEKCWTINAANSATAISQWDPSGTDNEYAQAKALFNSAKTTAENEFAAGHYLFSHMTYIWMQGESDSAKGTTAADYSSQFAKINDALKKDMTMTVGTESKTFDFGSMISVRVGNLTPMFTYNDITMNGQRIGHLNLANSAEYPDVYMVSDVGDTWVQTNNQRETGALKDYFKKYYPTGVLTYPTQNGTPNVIPENCQKIHYGFHYSQVGYNEIGMDAVRGICNIMGITKSDEVSKIRLLKENGYEEFDDIIPLKVGKEVKVIPTVSPIWKSYTKMKVETTGGVVQTDVYNFKMNSTGTVKFTLGDGTEKTVTLRSVYYGDANKDGKIDIKDLLIMKKYTVQIKVDIDIYAADVVTNGKITTVDMLTLKKFIVGMNVTLGPID